MHVDQLYTDQRVLFCQTIFSTLDHVMQWVRNKDVVLGDKGKLITRVHNIYIYLLFTLDIKIACSLKFYYRIA